MRCHWSWFFKYWCLLIDKCCILGLQQILTFFKYYIRIRIKNADSDPEEGHCLRILSGSESETQLTAPVPITCNHAELLRHSFCGLTAFACQRANNGFLIILGGTSFYSISPIDQSE